MTMYVYMYSKWPPLQRSLRFPLHVATALELRGKGPHAGPRAAKQASSIIWRGMTAGAGKMRNQMSKNS